MVLTSRVYVVKNVVSLRTQPSKKAHQADGAIFHAHGSETGEDDGYCDGILQSWWASREMLLGGYFYC